MPRWRKGDPYFIHPNPEVLCGIAAIATYLDKSYNTVDSWIKNKGLPAVKLPTGEWTTSKQAVIAWILQGIEHTPLPMDPLILVLLTRTIARAESTQLPSSEPEAPVDPYSGERLPSVSDALEKPLHIGTGAISRLN